MFDPDAHLRLIMSVEVPTSVKVLRTDGIFFNETLVKIQILVILMIISLYQ